MNTILAYDGSFDGFLSGVYEIYDRKLMGVPLQKQAITSETFFDTIETINTNSRKAARVWKGIKKNCSTQGRQNIYKVFLSESPLTESLLLHYLHRAFTEKGKIDSDFSDPKVLEVSKIAKKVDREKHRMDAFVRFKQTKDGIYFAIVAPDFNTLPLNASHFKKRYADQKWIIYDTKRDYGLFYNLNTVETITIDLPPSILNATTSNAIFTSEEIQFQELWKNYFKSTNIVSRKNMKLHIQHVPKRYWKYLSEKQST
ncbi:TIGR03915 family putative DNA repair protein [Cochleicola gelatinilyticus]|uniref:DNA metabolism protein n=1 Tax=Cochleicola gelatinilyticus TaxID=1763537 RepID=A0A167EX55_9FLAO|nr:TIGR03915 family putative DNA repair protein [Cochleicola gelatinilyticus]OAB75961.1 DNA metabolism protein [Cochleicola gelatinilyticus]